MVTYLALLLFLRVLPVAIRAVNEFCERTLLGLFDEFPNLKIAVGRWGTEIDDSKSMLLAGADKVGTTIIESREHIMQLCHTKSDSESQIEATKALRSLEVSRPVIS